MNKYKMLVIGLSAGGLSEVKYILNSLPEDFPLPIAIVSHVPSNKKSFLSELLNKNSKLLVTMVKDKETIMNNQVYVAPPGYHLLIEKGIHSKNKFALSVDSPVKSVRPSIDVLFESAAEVFEFSLIAILLSSANSDGSEGMGYIKKLGGLNIVLDPNVSDFSMSASEVIKNSNADYIYNLDEMINLLRSIIKKP